MTVSSTTAKVSYAGNGATTVFAVPFYFLAAADLRVILRTGTTESIQSLTTNYTVTGAGNESGGSVTMLVAPAAGTTITILRNAAATQETDLLPNDRLPAESLEDALDKLTMLVQQLGESADRSLKYPASDAAASPTIPAASARASKFLTFDANGLPVATVGVDATTDIFTQAGTGAVPRSVNSKLRDIISVKDFGAVGDGATNDTAAVQAALQAQQSLSNVTLVFQPGTYNISSQLTQTLTAPMVIYCDGNVTLNWASASVATHLWKVTLNGYSFENIGPGTLTIQCNNKLSRGIDIQNDVDSSRPDVDLGNIRALNLLANNAAGFGISVSGRIGTVRGNRLEVDGLTRTTSAGSCQAIAIYRTSFSRGPLKVLVNEAVAKNVTCNVADWDADGLLVYNNFEDGVEVHVRRASFYNCRGRGFKFQTGAAIPVIDDVYYYRDIAPTSGSNASAVGAGQYGALLVRQATVEFAGSSTHGGAGTVLFGVSHPGTSPELVRGISLAMIENVTVLNNSTDTTPITLTSATYTGSDTNERLITLKNWKVIGGLVRYVSTLLSLGQSNRTRFDVDGMIAPFALSTAATVTDRGCLFATNGNGQFLTGSVRGVINTTTDVDLPLVRDYSGVENAKGRFYDGGGNKGWKIAAASVLQSGLQPTGVAIGSPANYDASFVGGLFCQTYRITDGSTLSVPAFGYQSEGSGEFKVALHDYDTSGEYSVVSGSTTVTTIRAASANVQIGSGSEPGSGILRIWKNGINGPLNLKAVGDSIYVTVILFPY